MKHKQRTIAMALTSVMLTGVVAGCSSAGNKPEATGDGGTGAIKPATYTWLVGDRIEGPIRQDWEIFKEIEKKTGAKIEFQAVPATSLEEKKKILIATNSVPDIMHITNQEGREQGPEGVFLNLKTYLDKAPNIKKYFDENPEAKALATAADGGIYTVPNLDSYIGGKGFDHAWYLRKDLLDKYGLKVPTNMDEFYQVLKGLKQQNPDSYPLTMFPPATEKKMGLYTVFLRAFTGIQGLINLNPDNDTYTFAGYQKGFKETLQYLNKLYSEKLLDPEYSLLTRAQFDERLISNKSFVTFVWKADIEDIAEKARKASGNAEYNMEGFMQVTAPNVKNYQFARSVVNVNGIALSNKVKDKEAAVKLLDFLVGDEGKKLLSLGIEGKTYQMVDGKPRYLESFGTSPFNGLRKDYGVWFPGIGSDFALARLAWESALNPRTKKVNEAYEPIIVPAPRGYAKTKEEQELEKSKLSNLDKYMDQKMAEFVVGKTPVNDDTIKEFIDQTKKLGLDEILTMYNTAYKRTYGGK
ncbi:extracellular solute-binding protein [Paenibacillus sp. WQ 127069]|uniref:Extracellular solute-binding protein n=1 Tax=Paenibacillus baimaensis TaxID=2982185 RepID=A0ABT2UIH0_9BACL|nr:extracellular solute-binding protein [Paenibacillus sp. WQ 127069]MCU6794445.1 extracellular solute-binding protein [Paenibacillus sp. WQ 127069]